MTRDRLLTAVAKALAEAEGVEPNALDYRLYNHINPDVLERLHRQSDTSWELTFQVARHEVTVSDDGHVAIDGVTRGRGDQEESRPAPAAHARPDHDLHDVSKPFDRLPGMVYRCRNERGWPMEFMSDGCRELTGFHPNAFVLEGVSYGIDLIHPADQEMVWDTVQEALQARKPFTLTYRIQPSDGGVKWVWEKGSGVYEDGEAAAIVGFITELTGRQKPATSHKHLQP